MLDDLAVGVAVEEVGLGSERDVVPRLLDGDVDLAIGAPRYDHAEFMTQTLSEGLPWCAVFGPLHPAWAQGLDRAAWLASEHLQLVPGEAPHQGSGLDRALAAQGLSRTIRARVAQLSTWTAVLRGSAMVGSLPGPSARAVAEGAGLRAVPHPLGALCPPLSVRAAWHVRRQTDAGHRWLRGQVLAAAACLRRPGSPPTGRRGPPPAQ